MNFNCDSDNTKNLKKLPKKEDIDAIAEYYKFEERLKVFGTKKLDLYNFIYNKMNNAPDFLSIVNAIYLNTEYSTPYFANDDQTVSIAFFTNAISSFIERKLGKTFIQYYNTFIMGCYGLIAYKKESAVSKLQIGYNFCYLKPCIISVYAFIYAIRYTELMNNAESDMEAYMTNQLCFGNIEKKFSAALDIIMHTGSTYENTNDFIIRNETSIINVSKTVTDEFLHKIFESVASILFSFSFGDGLYPVTDKKIDQERRLHLIYLLLKENGIFALIK